MKNKICSLCDKGRLSQGSTLHSGQEYKGHQIAINMTYGLCDHCGGEVADADQVRQNKHALLLFKAKIDYGVKAEKFSIPVLRAIYDRHVDLYGSSKQYWAMKIYRMPGKNRLPRGLMNQQIFI